MSVGLRFESEGGLLEKWSFILFYFILLVDCHVGRNIFRQRFEVGDREVDIEQCRVSQFNREA